MSNSDGFDKGLKVVTIILVVIYLVLLGYTAITDIDLFKEIINRRVSEMRIWQFILIIVTVNWIFKGK